MVLCPSLSSRRICSAIGSPTAESWANGLKLAKDINYQFPQLATTDLSVLIPSRSDDATNLIKSLCSWNPCKRPAAAEVLQHPFFKRCFYIPPSLRTGAVTRTPPSAGRTTVIVTSHHIHVTHHAVNTLQQSHSEINRTNHH